MSASRASNLRELRDELQQALTDDGAPLPATLREGLAELWPDEAITEYRAWCAGGPPPTSAGGLQLLYNHFWLDANI